MKPAVRQRFAILVTVVSLTAALAQQTQTPPPQASPRPTPDPNRPVSIFVFDMANNGMQLTTAADGVIFDMDGTGSPVRVGWTSAGSDDAFIFLDTNGNNQVDSGRELLGNGIRRKNGERVVSADDALVEIQGHVRPASGRMPPELQHIGSVDGDDEVFGRLRVWRDMNHDGRSRATELQTMTEAGVLRLAVSFLRLNREIDEAGTVYLLEGSFWMLQRGVQFRRKLIQVEFARGAASR